MLLRQTPCVSPDSDMALECAAINGHREVAQLLVNGVPAKSEMSDGTSVLMQALLGFLPPAHRGGLLQLVILVYRGWTYCSQGIKVLEFREQE